MDGCDRKVPVDVTHPVSQPFLELFDVVVNEPAMGALIIAVFDQRYRSIRRPLHMVPVIDGNC
jgi:hypothetical protein